MKINDVMSAYEEQLKKYEKLSFSDAQEKIKSISVEMDEKKKKNDTSKVFESTLYLVLDYVKNGNYELLKSSEFDLEDIINIAYELWYEKISNLEILKYDNIKKVLNNSFNNQIISRLNPCEEELKMIYPYGFEKTQKIFDSLLEVYIKLRNERMNFSYDDFIIECIKNCDSIQFDFNDRSFNMRHLYGYLDTFEIIYKAISDNDENEVNISKNNIKKLSKLLATTCKTESISDEIISDKYTEDETLDKLLVEELNEEVFENSDLSELQKDVLAMRLGLQEYNQTYNLKEVGEKYNKSRESVITIQGKIYQKLHRNKKVKELLNNLYEGRKKNFTGRKW